MLISANVRRKKHVPKSSDEQKTRKVLEGSALNSVGSVTVPDPGSRDRDVVLVKRGVWWGNPRGVGNLECGGDGNGEVSLRATWDQGGQGRITPKEGFQVRGIKGEVNRK